MITLNLKEPCLIKMKFENKYKQKRTRNAMQLTNTHTTANPYNYAQAPIHTFQVQEIYKLHPDFAPPSQIRRPDPINLGALLYIDI